MLLSVLCEQKCVTILVVVKHLKVTLFQSLAIHYFVPYDSFNVSLVESLSYDEMQKNKKKLIICFQQDKISEAMLDWRWCFFWSELPTQGRNFRSSPEISSLLRSRVLGNQNYFCRNFRPCVGTPDEHWKFCVTSDRALSGDCLWTDRSDRSGPE